MTDRKIELRAERVIRRTENATIAAERRRAAEVAAFERLTEPWRRIAEVVARDLAVPPDWLAPLLERLADSTVPEDRVPDVLATAFEIFEVYAKTVYLVPGDEEIALARAIHKAREIHDLVDHAALLADLDRDLAEMDRPGQGTGTRHERARADLHFQKAAIHRALSDNRAAAAELERGLGLDPDATSGWLELGDVHRDHGSATDAEAAYRTAMKTADRLGDARELSFAIDRIGDLRATAGDRDGALEGYRTAMALAEALARQYPRHVALQQDLVLRRVKLADAEPEHAVEHYEAALGIAAAVRDRRRRASMVADLERRLAAARSGS
ncbi:hypothetical protein [Oharaeibacter diazotrophicus]|uniref:Uncharacterized protein n=1 Tax=Oharaeibacter diazotrophicus TaxID=1920512 RepID=A0A4R6RMF5_9HYPH|nr:hypothetical protein [Oharaeibacter diazotrophicus]TDP87207.1 hypothetical protein EDD54_1094 [Oharaeibacter diazotrophicus]BBE70850.1 hypothetical protein OHA_1_00418 [Pleomorphomonas sp. SM30]GLS77599.1 hypothetical protein GCM10007904_29360 [Oharaeibacter diazotrophicus]